MYLFENTYSVIERTKSV